MHNLAHYEAIPRNKTFSLLSDYLTTMQINTLSTSLII